METKIEAKLESSLNEGGYFDTFGDQVGVIIYRSKYIFNKIKIDTTTEADF